MASVEQLLGLLGRQVEARGSELTSRLGVSQPTLSRLVAAAGERVCRMGRARATRYALTRSIPHVGSRVPVHQIDAEGAIRQYGVLHLLTHGHHWLEREEGTGRRFEGLPPFAADMSPQGYIGRSFMQRHPELGLPPSIAHWSDDHRLVALARCGEDCTGDFILGEESLNRFLAETPRPVHRGDYPELARRSLMGEPGSSAAGEQPKFAAYSEGRHVLVKFAGGDEGAAARRWMDLLACERYALEAVRAAEIPSASSTLIDAEGYRFLEVERFDRIGPRGRRSLVSLGAIDDEYFGYRDTWTSAARRMLDAKFIDTEEARRMRWLDTFGQLIGNTDQHFGNLSFFVEDTGSFVQDIVKLRLAPVYDMLPMVFAPRGTSVVESRFTPQPPNANNFDVWHHAARCAVVYWERLVDSAELSDGFRTLAARCRDDVERLLSSRGYPSAPA
jgi:hypothetical protein